MIMPHPPKPSHKKNAPPSHDMCPVGKVVIWLQIRRWPYKWSHKENDTSASKDQRRENEETRRRKQD
jgi:hypothetical protein